MTATEGLDLNQVSVFVRVVETGSFTAAARTLGLPKSSVSRRVSALEKSLGVRLLQRGTRKLVLTEAGRLYFERARAALAGLADVNAAVTDMSREIGGPIRFTAGGDNTGLIANLISEFLRRYPHLQGAIWDLPATLEVARRILDDRAPSLGARIELRAVDYLAAELPGPVDAIFMSNIIHSETAETNAALVRKCFDALAPGGMLIVKDHIMNRELTEPAAGAVFALYLLLTTHGRDFSFDEVCWWMREAGFRDLEERALPSPPFTSSMVIAHKL